MLQPLQTKNRQRIATKVTIPVPLGGWNARDSYDMMPPTDAITMDNWIPRESYTELRKGYIQRITLAENIKTLFSYDVASNRKLLGAANGKIYDFDLGADTATQLASGYNTDEWQYILYKDRIFAVNGDDTPFVYNGSTVAATGFTGSGLTLSDLVNVVQFKNRLFFVEKNTLKFWYTNAAGNITGTLLSFDLNQFSKLGGEIIGIDTWGQDDSQLVIITSEGEVFIYSGTDPSDATNWYLRDIFTIPKPIGYRCTAQLAGDLIIITQEGYYPLSRVLAVDNSNKAVAFSDKISGAVKELNNKFTDLRWQILFYPSGNFLIVNTPDRISRVSYQHIMNTTNGLWCRFKNQDACCFAVFNNNLYFAGRTGNVYQANFGNDDNGSNIEGYVQQAYSDYGMQNLKKWSEIQPLISASIDLALNIYFGVDFETAKAVAESTSTTSGTKWNAVKWNTSKWSGGSTMLQKRILLIAKTGYKGSIGMKISTKQSDAKWYSTILVFEGGYGLK